MQWSDFFPGWVKALSPRSASGKVFLFFLIGFDPRKKRSAALKVVDFFQQTELKLS